MKDLGMGEANWTRVQLQSGTEKSLPVGGSWRLMTGSGGEEMPLRTKVRSGMGSDGVAAKVWVQKHLSPNL